MRLMRVMCMFVCTLVAMIIWVLMAMVRVMFTLFMRAVFMFVHRDALRCSIIAPRLF